MTAKIYNYALAGATALLMVSCEGEDLFNDSTEAEAKLAEAYLDAEAAFSNTYSIVDIALRHDKTGNGDTAVIDGANVYREAEKIYIDYGNGVIGSDGRTRTGMIEVSGTGDYFEAGGTILTTFHEYTMDKQPVKGSFSATNNGNDSLAFSISGFSIDENFSLNSEKSMKWTSGFQTKDDDTDDSYTLYGEATGVGEDENALMVDISEPVVFTRTCRYGFVSGVMELSFSVDTASEAASGGIDFIESDQCNNVARINIEKGESAVSLVRQFDGL